MVQILTWIKKHKLLISISLFVSVVFICGAVVYAEDTSFARQWTSFMENNRKYFTNHNYVIDIFRWIGWKIVLLLEMILNAAEALYKTSVGLLDFTSYDSVNQFINNSKPIWTAFLVGSLIYIGFTFIIAKEKKNDYVKSFVIAALCFVSLGAIMSAINEAVITYVDETNTKDEITKDIITNNLWDLLNGINKNGMEFDINANKSDCRISADDYKKKKELLDINEVVDYESGKITNEKARDVWRYKPGSDYVKGSDLKAAYTEDALKDVAISSLVNGYFGPIKGIMDMSEIPPWISGVEDDGEYLMGTEVSRGLLGDVADNYGNEFFYRYYVDYLTIYVEMLAFIIVYLALTYKVVRVIFELSIKRVLAFFYSADLNGTQKTVKILASIKDGYIVIMLGCILIKFFFYMKKYISIYKDNKAVYLIMLIMLAFAVVDGPDIVQQLTGIDAGLSGGVGKWMAASHIGRGVSRAASNTARGIGRGAMHGVSHAKNKKSSVAESAMREKNNISATEKSKFASNDDIKNMNQMQDKDKQGFEPGKSGNEVNSSENGKMNDFNSDIAQGLSSAGVMNNSFAGDGASNYSNNDIEKSFGSDAASSGMEKNLGNAFNLDSGKFTNSESNDKNRDGIKNLSNKDLKANMDKMAEDIYGNARNGNNNLFNGAGNHNISSPLSNGSKSRGVTESSKGSRGISSSKHDNGIFGTKRSFSNSSTISLNNIMEQENLFSRS